MKKYITMLKVNHYIKNLIVIFPLFFSKKYLNLECWYNCLTVLLAFCMISSVVYILNDIVDINKDKLHPLKKNRLIAKGEISKTTAYIIMIFLLVLSLFLGFIVNKVCALLILLYFILNIFYSFILKNIALIDIASIAIGFILRILTGCFAINFMPPPLMVLLTFFLSMFFTFSKRKLEFNLLDKDSCRESLNGFDNSVLTQFVLINAVLSIAFYIIYVLDVNAVENVGNAYLYITTIPFSLIIFRLLFLINTKTVIDDPIYFIEKDKILKTLFVLYIVTFAVILYL